MYVKHTQLRRGDTGFRPDTTRLRLHARCLGATRCYQNITTTKLVRPQDRGEIHKDTTQRREAVSATAPHSCLPVQTVTVCMPGSLGQPGGFDVRAGVCVCVCVYNGKTRAREK